MAKSAKYVQLFVNILFIVVIGYLLYHVVSYISRLMKSGCGKHGRFIVQEGFATNFDDSKKYFAGLMEKCTKMDADISTYITRTDTLVGNLDLLQKDICYVTAQIDEGLQGNYASNVPEDEQALPPDEQKKRADARQKNSVKYVASLKANFIKAHDDVPLLECFDGSGMTDAQDADLDTIRNNLNSKIDEVAANLEQFDISLRNLQKIYANDRLKTYYSTLNYNDKYIKQMVAAAANPIEGFASEDSDDSESSTDAEFNFKPVKQVVRDDDEAGPEQRVSTLTDNFNQSVSVFNSLFKKYTRYNNTVKSQTQALKTSKKLITDTDEQKKQISAGIEKTKSPI